MQIQNSPKETKELTSDKLTALCDRIALRLGETPSLALDMSQLSTELIIPMDDVITAAEHGVRTGRFVKDNSQIAKIPEFQPDEDWSQCIKLPGW